MSFDSFEISTESSRPIELYEFNLGTEFFRYTSAEDTISVGGNDFEPVAISRNEIQQGSDQNNRNLLITMPTILSLAQDYISVPPASKLTVNVFRYQRDDLVDQVLLFKGTVQAVRYPGDGTSAEFAIRSIETAMNRNVPRFTFMGMCNHILFDDGCGVNPAPFDHLGNVDSIDVGANTITIAGLGASGIDFVGGYVTPTGVNDFRMVLAQSGDTLTMLLPFAEDPTGTNAQAFAGCDHTLTGDCALVFDNVAEFGGFHFVPSKDVFARGLE